METLAKKQIVFDYIIDGDGRENTSTFGEQPVERRWVQLPQAAFRKYMSYDEFRNWYITKIDNLRKIPAPDCDIYRRMTTKWIDRNIQLMWEEALSDEDKELGRYTPKREYSPEVKKIIDANKYVAEHFDEIWNEIEEWWQEKEKARKEQEEAEKKEEEVIVVRSAEEEARRAAAEERLNSGRYD